MLVHMLRSREGARAYNDADWYYTLADKSKACIAPLHSSGRIAKHFFSGRERVWVGVLWKFLLMRHTGSGDHTNSSLTVEMSECSTDTGTGTGWWWNDSHTFIKPSIYSKPRCPGGVHELLYPFRLLDTTTITESERWSEEAHRLELYMELTGLRLRPHSDSPNAFFNAPNPYFIVHRPQWKAPSTSDTVHKRTHFLTSPRGAMSSSISSVRFVLWALFSHLCW